MSLGPVPGSASTGGAHATVGGRLEHDRWKRRVRLERQLHDGAALRISALTLRLGLLRGHDAGFERSVGELQDELHAVLDELRAVANQIYPSVLDEAGLGPALRELADAAGVCASVRAGDERFGTAAEGAAYFAVADCLLAAGTDSGPVDVVVHRADGQLVLSLHGVAGCHAELVQDHARPLGGSVHVAQASAESAECSESAVSSPATVLSKGCTITVTIPCE